MQFATIIAERIKSNAAARSKDNLTIGPVMTHTTAEILEHTRKLLDIPGAELVMGGKEIEGHDVPECYGMVEPTAVYVPLDQILKEENFSTVCSELFGPFFVVTSYDDSTLPGVLEACERMSHHLTAAVVSNDSDFQQKVRGEPPTELCREAVT